MHLSYALKHINKYSLSHTNSLSLYKQPENPEQMNQNNLLYKVINFYIDGFKNMTVGKTLWTIILLKVFIIFAILKLFLFPDFLSSKSSTEEGKADYVRSELINRNK